MNRLKKELRELYLSRWRLFSREMLNDSKSRVHHHPLLLSVTDAFESEWDKADLRIMIFGISPNGWGEKDFNVYDFDSDVAIKKLMTKYEKFYFNGGNWGHGEAFWNYYYSIEQLLRYRLQKNVKTIWNNVYKMHESKQEIEFRLFRVAQDEIKIFQPDLILVLGVGKDCRNTFYSIISGDKINWVDYEVWDVTNEDEPFLFYDLPANGFRELSNRLNKILITYHPNAHGNNAGIKLKLLIDELVNLLQ